MATKELGKVEIELSNEHCGTDADGHTWLEYWDGAWRAQCGHRDSLNRSVHQGMFYRPQNPIVRQLIDENQG